MPIPTPEPPVKRYAIEAVRIYGATDLAIESDSDGEWCKWSEVEALLLQRAQEIARLTGEWSVMARACANWRSFDSGHLSPETLERRRLIADNEWECAARAFLERDKLRAQLAARAQEIEQVKAERDRLREFIDVLDDRSLEDLVQARREGSYAGDVHDAPDDCETLVPITRGELRRLRTADAALVSRAPQQEQEPVLPHTPFDHGVSAVARHVGFVKAELKQVDEERLDYSQSMAPSLHKLGERLDALAAPFPAPAALQALEAKFRETARLLYATNAECWRSSAETYVRCADELAAALSRAEQP